MKKHIRTMQELDDASFSDRSTSSFLSSSGYGFFTTGSFGESIAKGHKEELEELKVDTNENEDISRNVKDVTRASDSPITVVLWGKVFEDDMPFAMDDVTENYDSLKGDKKDAADKFIAQHGIKVTESTANLSI